MNTFTDFIIIATAVLFALQANYFVTIFECRLIRWWCLPRCSICNDKCSNMLSVADKGGELKGTTLCDFHFREAIEMHRRQAEENLAAEDREGEEWKDGPRE